MSDLGQLLRKARTERNITLDQLQESTKIRKRYLEAIEEGHYEVLPGAFYARAFVKQYSEAVGLDPEEVFRLYAHAIPPAESEASHEPIRMSRRSSVNPPERAGKWASAFLMIAFPILIIGVVYYFLYTNWEARDNIMPNEPLTESSAIEQAQSGLQPGEEDPLIPALPPEDEDPPAEELEQPKENVSYFDKFTFKGNPVERFKVTGADKLSIELKIVGAEAWIGLTHADTKSKYLHQGNMKQSESYSAEFDHDVYLNVGLANAVELTVNGVKIDMGTEPNPRKFQFELTEETSDAEE